MKLQEMEVKIQLLYIQKLDIKIILKEVILIRGWQKIHGYYDKNDNFVVDHDGPIIKWSIQIWPEEYRWVNKIFDTKDEALEAFFNALHENLDDKFGSDRIDEVFAEAIANS